MQLFVLLACLIGGLHYAEAAVKTHIYIDQIPIYTKLASCAQDRISAIVRAQASGCGDDTQLTSFACFCIDSSSQFASIISTAVKDQCSSAATEAALTARHAAEKTPVHRVRARATVTPAPTPSGVVAGNVKSALEAFDSYCSKSTELIRFHQDATVKITQAPETRSITPTPSASSASSAADTPDKTGTPIAAIVVPVVLVPLALGVALYFFLRRNRQQRDLGTKLHELQADSSISRGQPIMVSDHKYAQYGTEIHTAQHRVEMPTNETPAVELDAGAGVATHRNEKMGLT
ncbi:hypothetical protein P171DRAFT_481908 [Karstenula rhodostoma CBS 690.94]|uniref:Extracellular membrane protein CFEM domain-containing protein n=1 Tax=Karstenula rhodostoma CBS 690.94 TaxID=1392251 RepID=A0A9P4UGT0_9PLEO|nr:hypothetical protein P171DRAFT_481908 [Karstenula rhodostoma CBS 690.94]